MAVGGRLVWNEREYDELVHAKDGPVGRDLARRGEIGAQSAKRRCPVSPDGSHGRPSGYTRSKIGWELGRDEQGLYVDVASPAETPDGGPLGLFIEVGTEPHVITSHGPYPLRDRKGNVFGRRVQHPGTDPQPHLRPALDDMRQ
jgi:hypothetical protein